MNKNKDKSLIPPGHYCYKFDSFYDGPKLKLGSIPIVNCPHRTTKEFFGVDVPWCNFLECGGLYNGMKDEDFDKLVKGFGSEDKVFQKLDLDLLWDDVKECGENHEDTNEKEIEWIKKIKKIKNE